MRWCCTDRCWDSEEMGGGGGGGGGGVMTLAYFIRSFNSSRHSNMPGGHSREASSPTKTTERRRFSESKWEQSSHAKINESNIKWEPYKHDTTTSFKVLYLDFM